MTEHPPTTEADEDPQETMDILAQVFQDWKQTHPDGTWRSFWAAVSAGEVQMPDG